jgi:hypothetical protein
MKSCPGAGIAVTVITVSKAYAPSASGGGLSSMLPPAGGTHDTPIETRPRGGLPEPTMNDALDARPRTTGCGASEPESQKRADEDVPPAVLRIAPVTRKLELLAEVPASTLAAKTNRVDAMLSRAARLRRIRFRTIVKPLHSLYPCNTNRSRLFCG